MNPVNNFYSEIFPKEFLEYFEVKKYEVLCDVATKKEYFEIYIDEKHKFPSDVSRSDYDSKGFDSSKKIQDFPIRGKAVYLNIRTRLWRHKQNGNIIKNNYNFEAQGTKLTKELSDFLKYRSQ